MGGGGGRGDCALWVMSAYVNGYGDVYGDVYGVEMSLRWMLYGAVVVDVDVDVNVDGVYVYWRREISFMCIVRLCVYGCVCTAVNRTGGCTGDVNRYRSVQGNRHVHVWMCGCVVCVCIHTCMYRYRKCTGRCVQLCTASSIHPSTHHPSPITHLHTAGESVGRSICCLPG